MRTCRQVTDLSFSNVKLRPIAIPQRRPADHADFAFKLDLADALQLLAQDLDFPGDLVFVGCMLIMAAAARRKQRAWWRYTSRRRREHFDQRSMYVLPKV